ncbi:MAG: phosphoenolpyruvate synthase [Fimbriimonas sp.]
MSRLPSSTPSGSTERDRPRPSPDLILDFANIGLDDVACVGGKNASLGELYAMLRPLGITAVDGFAVTTAAYRETIPTSLRQRLAAILERAKQNDIISLQEAGEEARNLVMEHPLSPALVSALIDAHDRLVERLGYLPSLAVRSSATSEDLPGASFAGQHSTFLNVRGRDELVAAVHRCFASLYTDRAIDYRNRNGFDHLQAELSVGIQPMIRSDLAASGVIFTLDPESGFRDAIVISGAYGLGESVVQGTVEPDEWTIFKPTLESGHMPIVNRRKGSKETKIVFGEREEGTVVAEVLESERARFCLSDEDVLQLARWARTIEDYYGRRAGKPQPMDIEWAKDGITGGLYILQARPETVHSTRIRGHAAVYRFIERTPTPLIEGVAVGQKIASGPVRVIQSPAQLEEVRSGDVIVTASTDPAWEPIMKRAAAIVTEQGGRTAHAAIVSREIGIPCIVGAGNATSILTGAGTVTVSCAQGACGYVYPGQVLFEVDQVNLADSAKTSTRLMVNVGDPAKAFTTAALPHDGVGLARIEFIVTDAIGIHPMALSRYPDLKDAVAVEEIRKRLGGEEPKEFFVRRLSEGVAQIAAAFFPKPVIVRTSDFKTNEYAQLLGGAEFEPAEENPMLGFRGASRYYDPRYADGFRLECLALKRVREEMGLTNVKVMIPFCRTPEDGRRVVAAMKAHGLEPRMNGVEVYAMCEVPSNAIDADEFLDIFDGFSIGSNDLTQLTLGIDRDSAAVSHLFDESDYAVKSLIVMAIEAAKRHRKPIGLCGQAPSDCPAFARWLVSHGIDSISLTPDALLRTRAVVAEAEEEKKRFTMRASAL